MSTTTPNTDAPDADRTVQPPPLTSAPSCPKCGGRMWDNRLSKRNPRAPDFKCRDPRCDGVVWPGGHTAAQPIVARPRREEDAPADPTEGDDTRHTREPREPTNAPAVDGLRLRYARYLAVTDFVLAEVRPRYEAAGVTCTDATIAAIAATLFVGLWKTRGHEDGR